MKPMKNVTDPKSMRATEIPRKSEPKAAGDEVGACLDDEASNCPPECKVGKGRARGGDVRRWMIMEQSS